MSDFMFTSFDSVFTIENFDRSVDLGLFVNVLPGTNGFQGTNAADSLKQVHDPSGNSAGVMEVHLNFTHGTSGYCQINYGFNTPGDAQLSTGGAKYITFWIYLPDTENIPNLRIQLFAMDDINWQWKGTQFNANDIPKDVWIPLSIPLDSVYAVDPLFDLLHGVIAQTGFQIGNFNDSTPIWSGDI